MRKMIRCGVAAAVLGIAPALAPAWAVTPGTAAGKAPVPEQIVSAKSIFISNGGTRCDLSRKGFRGGPDRAYDEFYAGMEKWGHYKLAASPGNAELDFKISFACPAEAADVMNGNSTGFSYDPQLRLVIRDVKTHVELWAITRHLRFTRVLFIHTSNFDSAMRQLLGDVKDLAAGKT